MGDPLLSYSVSVLHVWGESNPFGAKIDVSWGKNPIEENNLNHSNSSRWYCILGEESRYFVHMTSMDIDAPVSIAHRPSIPQSGAT